MVSHRFFGLKNPKNNGFQFALLRKIVKACYAERIAFGRNMVSLNKCLCSKPRRRIAAFPLPREGGFATSGDGVVWEARLIWQ